MQPPNVSSDHLRVEHLQRQIEELKKSWPAHSVPAAMLQRLEELEDELEKAIQQMKAPDRPRSTSTG